MMRLSFGLRECNGFINKYIIRIIIKMFKEFVNIIHVNIIKYLLKSKVSK